MRITCLFVGLFILTISVQAQDCFKTFMTKGQAAYQAFDFEKAIRQFEAAKVCSGLSTAQEEEVDEWLDKTRNGYIRRLKSGLLTVQSLINLEMRGDATRGLRFAQHAYELDPNLDAQRMLYQNYYSTAEYPAKRLYQTIGQLPNGVRHLDLSDDGQLLVAMGASTATIFNAETGALVREFKSDNWAVNWMEFMPDNKSVMMACSDGQIRFNALEDGHVLKAFQLSQTAEIFFAKWSPYRDYYLVAVEGEGLRAYNAEGDLLFEKEITEAPVYTVNYSPSGDYFISFSLGLFGNKASLWSKDGELVCELGKPGTGVMDAIFSETSNQLLVAYDDGSAAVLGTDCQPKVSVKSGSIAKFVAFSPDNQHFLTANSDLTVRLWRMDGQEVAVLAGHETDIAKAFFLHNGLIVTTTFDGQVRIWHPSGTLLALLGGHQKSVISAAFTADSGVLFTGSMSGLVRRWPLRPGLVRTLSGHTAALNSIVFSPNSEMVMTSSYDGTARIWGRNGTLLRIVAPVQAQPIRYAAFAPRGEYFVLQDPTLLMLFRDPLGEEGPVASWPISPAGKFSFSSDGQQILSFNAQNKGQLHNLKGDLLKEYDLFGHPANNACFDPTGNYVLFSTQDNKIHLYKKDGTFLNTIASHEMPIREIHFSPDGTRILSASNDGTARLWNFKGEELVRMEGHKQGCFLARFTPDGQHIITSGGSYKIKQWNAEGQFEKSLEAHDFLVKAIDFTADSQHMLTVSADNTCRVWSLAEGDIIVSFTGHIMSNILDSLVDGCISPDGRYLATCSSSDGGRIYPLDPSLILEMLESVTIDELPVEQLQKYGLDTGEE